MEGGAMSRRAFMTASAASAAAAALPDAEAPVPPEPPREGEPYALASKRLVFTTWLFVRPGSFGWFSRDGRNVSVAGSEGPTEATFRRGDDPRGLRIAVRPAARVGPVVRMEKPWEVNGKGIGLATVIQEGNRFRAWGMCGSGGCILESSDGLHWERPELGLVEHGGDHKNNLVPFSFWEGGVFVDPSAPPEERYKWVGLRSISREAYDAFRKARPEAWHPRSERKDANLLFALCGAVSQDGVRWTALPEPLTLEHSDTMVTGYYDERLRRYVIYTRNYMIGQRAATAEGEPPLVWWGGDAGGVARRSIGRTESADFRRFPLSHVIVEPGPDMPPDDLYYTNGRTSVPGAPDHHLLFPSVWHTSNDTTSVVVLSSHDGRLWHRLPGPPVFETAPFGQWDGGAVFGGTNLIELPDGGWALPYTGYDVPHKYPRGQFRFAPGLAVWPKGRLVALESEGRAAFSTALFLPPGRKALLNALTMRAGRIEVEVAGPDGAALPGRSFADCRPVVGDAYRQPIVWGDRDDLGHAERQPVMLRVRMDQAAIFAIDFE